MIIMCFHLCHIMISMMGINESCRDIKARRNIFILCYFCHTMIMIFYLFIWQLQYLEYYHSNAWNLFQRFLIIMSFMFESLHQIQLSMGNKIFGYYTWRVALYLENSRTKESESITPARWCYTLDTALLRWDWRIRPLQILLSFAKKTNFYWKWIFDHYACSWNELFKCINQHCVFENT